MANSNKLYQAYRGAGKASIDYKASLYDIERTNIDKEHSAQQHQYRMLKLDENLKLISQGLGLASDLYGGYKAKQEAKAARATVQEGMAKEAYEGEISWGDLTETARQVELAKYAPKKVDRTLSEILSGVEQKYAFGEGGEGFTQAQISAASLLHDENKLASLIGMDKESAYESMISKFGESEEKKESSEVKKSIISGSNKYTGTKEQNIALSEKLGLDLNKYGSIREAFENMGFGDWSRAEEEYYKFFPKPIKQLAKGGEFTTDGPELILVGDNPGGKEKVKVKPIKPKSKKKEISEGEDKLSDNIGVSLGDLVSKKGTKPGSNKWLNNYISTQRINDEPLRPLKGELSKYNKKLFSMAEESGYFGEFFRGGWD